MNRQHWKAVLPFVQAYVDGKQVAYKKLPLDGEGSGMDFNGDPAGYFIVEPPKLKPWGIEDVRIGAWYRQKGSTDIFRIHGVRPSGVACVWLKLGWVPVAVLHDEWEWSPAMAGPWYPCAKEVA